MYLSRLILNPRSRQVQREVAQPYQMHRSIMRAFPNDLAPGDERVLFRLEGGSIHHQGGLVLLVQSLNRPDWSRLQEPGSQNLLLPLPENPAVKSFELDLAAGQLLAFRLSANPTVKRKFPNGDHKRVGLYREEEQIAWLQRKAEGGGFRIISLRIGQTDEVGGSLHRGEEKHSLKLLSVQYDGHLLVTDPLKLARAVRQGIGSGKGLGFGLLSLAPAGI